MSGIDHARLGLALRVGVVPALFALALIGPFLVWQFPGRPLAVLVEDSGALPPGQGFYLFSKLAALYAIALVALQIALALIRAAFPGKTVPPWSLPGHRLLGAFTVFAIIVHVAAFVAATSLRNEEFAWRLLLPVTGHGYYRTMVSVGAVALWLSIAGVTVRALDRYRPGIRRLHPVLMLTVAALGIAHSYGIGSESNTTSVLILYAATLTVIVALWISRRSRRQRRGTNRAVRHGPLR